MKQLLLDIFRDRERMTSAQLAQALGCCERSLRRWRRRKLLPEPVTVGLKLKVFLRSDVLKFANAN